MSVSTVNISFQNDFLLQIDQIASSESRSRSELIREAVRLYIDQKREFERIFSIGRQIGSTLDIAEEDIMPEIKKYRKSKQKVK
ncbi:MAG: ribbon-helix-helix protein, CopG family [Treponema sp.]|jgi:metal-responsive CopG/Arc/MetJ family transcriptional regulator|nr:ribbon-helix-helix protein, CopG family [Treponema sp.]